MNGYEYPRNLLIDLGIDEADIIPNMNTDGLGYALATLTERERKILFMRYAEGKTHKEIGESFGVTRERIRQVETKAIEKLRKPKAMAFIKNGRAVLIRCKYCRFFETDVVAKVNGIPLIVAHEMCKKWGDGCKTSPDGYCFMGEAKE